jgi:hypothetical protein
VGFADALLVVESVKQRFSNPIRRRPYVVGKLGRDDSAS